MERSASTPFGHTAAVNVPLIVSRFTGRVSPLASVWDRPLSVHPPLPQQLGKKSKSPAELVNRLSSTEGPSSADPSSGCGHYTQHLQYRVMAGARLRVCVCVCWQSENKLWRLHFKSSLNRKRLRGNAEEEEEEEEECWAFCAHKFALYLNESITFPRPLSYIEESRIGASSSWSSNPAEPRGAKHNQSNKSTSGLILSPVVPSMKHHVPS